MEEKLLKYWQLQEMLLQSYRLLIWIIHTVLLELAGLVGSLAPQPFVFYFTTMALAWIELFLGLKLIRLRSLDVSYFQMLILKQENDISQLPVLASFKKWQKFTKAEKKKILQEGGIYPSNSRKIFEQWLPVIYSWAWIAMTVALFYQSR